MTRLPTHETIMAMARLSGVTIDADTAQRILRAIGPGLEGFAPTAAELPFDLEPAGFRIAQKSGSGA